MSDQLPPNPLEVAIARVAEVGEDVAQEAAVAVREAVLNALFAARMAVLLEAPVPPGAPPEDGTPMLFVTDGENHETAMLALFTRPDRAREYHDQQGGSFAHPAEVPGPWALLQLPPGTGLMINPNHPAGSFRIGPDVAGQMRESLREWLESRPDADDSLQ